MSSNAISFEHAAWVLNKPFNQLLKQVNNDTTINNLFYHFSFLNSVNKVFPVTFFNKNTIILAEKWLGGPGYFS